MLLPLRVLLPLLRTLLLRPPLRLRAQASKLSKLQGKKKPALEPVFSYLRPPGRLPIAQLLGAL